MVFVIFTLYSTAALGQLFFFHMVLISMKQSTILLSRNKMQGLHYDSLQGMRTYDYILAMREVGAAYNLFEDSDSDESIDFDSPERPSFLSRMFCRNDAMGEVRKIKISVLTRLYYSHSIGANYKARFKH